MSEPEPENFSDDPMIQGLIEMLMKSIKGDVTMTKEMLEREGGLVIDRDAFDTSPLEETVNGSIDELLGMLPEPTQWDEEITGKIERLKFIGGVEKSEALLMVDHVQEDLLGWGLDEIQIKHVFNKLTQYTGAVIVCRQAAQTLYAEILDLCEGDQKRVTGLILANFTANSLVPPEDVDMNAFIAADAADWRSILFPRYFDDVERLAEILKQSRSEDKKS